MLPLKLKAFGTSSIAETLSGFDASAGSTKLALKAHYEAVQCVGRVMLTVLIPHFQHEAVSRLLNPCQ